MSRRDHEQSDCHHYDRCLGLAARRNHLWLPCKTEECPGYEPPTTEDRIRRCVEAVMWLELFGQIDPW